MLCSVKSGAHSCLGFQFGHALVHSRIAACVILLKACITAAVDSSIKHSLLMRLGAHYDFQAAQRNALNLISRESERDASELLYVGWDKMDQQKNVIPRVQALRNTQFLQGGSRLVVSLVGVWAPGLWANPIMYTVLEDQIHGANMIAALLVDMLLESVQRQNCLPRLSCSLFLWPYYRHE